MKKISRHIRVVIFLVLGLALLWWVTRGQDLEQIMMEVKNANYSWILLAMVAGVISHFVRALRWNILIHSMGFKTEALGTFHAVMSGYLANLVVPRLGEVTKCAVLSKSKGIPFNSLAGTMVVERFVDVLTLGFLMFFTIALQFSFLKSFLYDNFMKPLLAKGISNLLIIGIAGGVLFILLVVFAFWLRNMLRKAQPGSLAYKLRRQLRGFANGIKTLWLMNHKGVFLIYTLIIWVLYFFTAYLSFFAIDATSHLSPVAGITLLVVGSLGIVAPVPGGIGTYHFITILTLTQLYGIASEPATSYAYITHAMQMALIILTGGVLWLVFTFWHKSNKMNQ